MKRGGNAATITESEAPHPTKRMRGFVVNALSVAMHHASIIHPRRARFCKFPLTSINFRTSAFNIPFFSFRSYAPSFFTFFIRISTNPLARCRSVIMQ